MFKENDIIFMASGESAASIEHILQVKSYDAENNIVTTNKAVTFVKDLRSGSMQSFQNLGIFSSMPAIDGGDYGIITINLNNFDYYGLVTDKSMLDNFNKALSKLIVASPEESKKIIL